MNKPKKKGSEFFAELTPFERYIRRRRRWLAFVSFLIAFILGFLLFVPSGGGIRQAQHNARMQIARQIGQCLFAYATDHGGKYPVGKSSTDIFQQLIDQQYVTDPSLFYFAMPGKTPASTNRLKPENVCFDVTNGVLADDPNTLPVVMSTGYKIDYIQGGKAHLMANGDPTGIAVFFKGNNAAFLRTEKGEIALFPPAVNFQQENAEAFDPKGRTYLQLTPNGPLP